MRIDNIAMLNNTLDILSQGYYTIDDKRVPLKLTRAQMESASVYLPRDVQQIRKSTDFDHTRNTDKCTYDCVNSDSFTHARHMLSQISLEQDAKPILVLNLANPVHPGGGVRRGAKAQEEDLCRKSSLLLSVESRNAHPYYRYNRKLDTYMGSDGIVISPQVEIIKDENGNLLDDSVIVSVMTCAAPMIKYGKEGMSENEYETMVFQRIIGMLTVAAYLGYKYLVLGAFGCGAFRNDAHVVSDLFGRAFRAFDYDGMTADDMFRRVEFAVMDHSRDQYNFREFSRNFSREN